MKLAPIIPLRRAPAEGERSSRGQHPRSPTPIAVSDEALVAACALGDAAALGTLFDRHHEALFRFLDRLARRDPAEVDDLVQSTFVEVWRSASRFRAGSSVRTWIFGIAANLLRHRARSEGRRRAVLADLAIAPPSTPRPPDDAAIRRQLVDRLGDALAALPLELREVFVLCEVEEVPGVEVARALDLREGTVWRRLHEARKRLRAALGGAP